MTASTPENNPQSAAERYGIDPHEEWLVTDYLHAKDNPPSPRQLRNRKIAGLLLTSVLVTGITAGIVSEYMQPSQDSLVTKQNDSTIH